MGGAENKKRKRSFYGKKKKKEGLRAGMRGVLITCIRGKERFCVTEAVNLFNQYVEEIVEEKKKNGTFEQDFSKKEAEESEEGEEEEEEEEKEGEDEDSGAEEGPKGKKPKKGKNPSKPEAKEEEEEEEEEEGNDEIDFRAAFQKEISQLKKKDPHEKMVLNVKLEIQCVVFLKLHPSLDPVDLVRRIFEDAQNSRVAKTRYCTRFTPVEAICHADMNSLEKMDGKVLAKYFHAEDQKPHTYCVQYNTRNHRGGLDRDEVIRKLASMVGRPHSVDLHDAEFTILVEVCESVLCMSVVRGYKQFKKYNIVSVVNGEAHPPPPPKKKKEEEKKQEETNQEGQQEEPKEREKEEQEENQK